MSCERKNRLAQLVLLTAWISIILLQYPTFVGSQGCVQPTYANEPIRSNSWLPSTEVTVKIDGLFANDQRLGLKAGNEQWNNLALACSGVRFQGFDPVFMESYTQIPPKGELWWQRDDPKNGFNGGVFAVIGFGGFVEAARIKIHPNALTSPRALIITIWERTKLDIPLTYGIASRPQAATELNLQ